MTPEIITSLVNLGSAGAVIIVVVVFLAEIDKRDKQWQDFFTKINQNNADDIKGLGDALKEVSKSTSNIAQMLTDHDRRVEERIRDAAALVAPRGRKPS